MPISQQLQQRIIALNVDAQRPPINPLRLELQQPTRLLIRPPMRPSNLLRRSRLDLFVLVAHFTILQHFPANHASPGSVHVTISPIFLAPHVYASSVTASKQPAHPSDCHILPPTHISTAPFHPASSANAETPAAHLAPHQSPTSPYQSAEPAIPTAQPTSAPAPAHSAGPQKSSIFAFSALIRVISRFLSRCKCIIKKAHHKMIFFISKKN